MKCNQCGTENVEGTRFCKSCGSPMGVEQTKVQEEPQMTSQPTTQVTPQPMPQYNTSQQNGGQEMGNGIACMVLGIVSIVFGCTPLIGLVCGIIAIIMNRKDQQLGIQSSYHKAGFVCGIIGVCLGAITLVYCVVWVCFFACAASASMYNM